MAMATAMAQDVLAVLPARAHDLARLRILARRAAPPSITVVGKYNHGKSRLLNELMGSDIFAVADRRETVALAEHRQQQARWLDAPGLDADVARNDDDHSHRAIWLESDIRLFVHAAKEGELDAAERDLLQELRADQQRTLRQTIFVLTQVDQLSDDAHVDRVVAAIRAQSPEITLHLVSATRHRQGTEQGKQLLIQKSGIPALKESLSVAMAKVPPAREHEANLLFADIRNELLNLQTAEESRMQALGDLQQCQLRAFDEGLATVLDKVRNDLQPVLEVSGTDPALVPDSFENMFKLTAGKRERAHIQIAYSRACIAINAHLVRHGVVGLPMEQQTSVRSLDTVMVAVMGVSVKYRDDLRRIFCEPEGRARLQQDFGRYFELSEDRVTLAGQLADGAIRLAEIAKALAALERLERP
ncbi:50S ribosome-binding GTPase [Diaphorobacter sp. NR2-3-3-1]|nr:50S ribosome-binding GTPase [Diaphorobacter caeni]